ncbi:hypothetical protein N1851_014110 [Merluccius polli]|uniref:Uncharacterized protein n=1 Tax=Merluccius polli TaxID=89951 RepID=A0AA47P145_MERPO|nr:hypothetical protein N1851_014110 [Merluccius polli]
MKVDSKKSVLITGGGSGKPPPSPLDERVAGIIGETLLSGIVPEDEGDTDAGEMSQMDSAPDASSPASMHQRPQRPRLQRTQRPCVSLQHPCVSLQRTLHSIKLHSRRALGSCPH